MRNEKWPFYTGYMYKVMGRWDVAYIEKMDLENEKCIMQQLMAETYGY